MNSLDYLGHAKIDCNVGWMIGVNRSYTLFDCDGLLLCGFWNGEPPVLLSIKQDFADKMGYMK